MESRKRCRDAPTQEDAEAKARPPNGASVAWNDCVLVPQLTAAHREGIVVAWVLDRCKSGSLFYLDDARTVIALYGMHPLLEFLRRGKTGQVMTRRAFAVVHTAVTKFSQSVLGDGEGLYVYHGDCVRHYLTSVVQPALHGLGGSVLLGAVLRQWADFLVFVQWARRMFAVLDRTHVLQHDQLSTTARSLLLFKQGVFEGVCVDFMESVRARAAGIRRGAVHDVPSTRSAIELVLAMHAGKPRLGKSAVYTDIFEPAFLCDLQAHYRAAAAGWAEDMSIQEYVRTAEAGMASELAQCGQYVHHSTLPLVVCVLRRVLLEDRVPFLLQRDGHGIPQLFRGGNEEALSCMFRVISVVPGALPKLSAMFGQHIKERGSDVVCARNGDVVQHLIDLRAQCDVAVQSIFQGNCDFKRAVHEAWTHVMDSRRGGASVAQTVAESMDRVLRDTRAGEEGQYTHSANCVALVQCVSDKDVFQHFYEKLLGDRLLAGSSTSNDVEATIITALKHAHGGSFTLKMQGMVADMASSAANSAALGKAAPTTSAFDPRVLSRGHWPQFVALPLFVPPPHFTTAAADFTAFYKELHKDCRAVSWVWSRGTAEVGAGHYGGQDGTLERKTFKMSLLQAAACLRFNEQDRHASDALAGALGLSSPQLAAVMKPMVNRMRPAPGSHRPQKIPGPFKFIKAEQAYAVNYKYTTARREVLIGPPSLAAAPKEDAGRVDAGRAHQLDAAIVRVMKARQHMQHKDLVVEVARAVRLFTPQPVDIKRRIEKLLAQEYLERDEQGHGMYTYVA